MESIFKDCIATLDLDYPSFKLTFNIDFVYKKTYKKGKSYFYNLKNARQLKDLKDLLKTNELPYDFYDKELLEDTINFLE